MVYLPGDGTVLLRSRSGADITTVYPELTALGSVLGRPAILDGEIVAFDSEGRSDFELLQSRMGLSSAAKAARMAEVVPALVLFDAVRAGAGVRRACCRSRISARGVQLAVEVAVEVGGVGRQSFVALGVGCLPALGAAVLARAYGVPQAWRPGRRHRARARCGRSSSRCVARSPPSGSPLPGGLNLPSAWAAWPLTGGSGPIPGSGYIP